VLRLSCYTIEEIENRRKCDFLRKSAVLRFETPFGGLRYNDHLRLTGKRIVDFLLVLTELFSLGVTAEELRANIG